MAEPTSSADADVDVDAADADADTADHAANQAALDDLADLADLVLNVGRLIRARTPDGTDYVPLNDTERQVMRLIDLNPGCTSGDIAQRGRLQRSNVSTSLSSLERKGMIARTANGDRTVTVYPTQLAADNLTRLRAAWARELNEALHDDLSAVRRCTTLLARLEIQLNRQNE